MPLPKEGGGEALRDDPKDGRKSKETRGGIQKQNSHKQNDTFNISIKQFFHRKYGKIVK